MALRARDDIAKDLGVAAPSRLTIRFHPTTQSYERATGQAWFTSGAIVGGDIHLLPLAVLRDRGVLERTVMHELVHLMIDEPLMKRPASSVSVGAFWGRRWNTAFRDLAYRFLFRPLTARLGVTPAENLSRRARNETHLSRLRTSFRLLSFVFRRAVAARRPGCSGARHDGRGPARAVRPA